MPLDGAEAAKFEVEMMLNDRDEAGCMQGGITFNSDLYDLESMARLAAHTIILLQRALETQDVPLQELSVMGIAEGQLVMQEWNDTMQAYPKASVAHVLVEAVGCAMPRSLAVMHEGAQLTYGQLLVRTGHLAVRLKQRSGVEPDSVVGLCLEKSVEEVVGMVGIMRAGGAYVPLDPSLPGARLAYLVEQCECPAIVSQQKYFKCAVASASQSTVIVIAEDVMTESQDGGRQCAAGCGSGSSLAYVLFTSGSTGKPKGVMLQHNSLVPFMIATTADGGFYDSDTVLHTCSFTFDPSVELVWCTLSCGAKLVLGKPGSLTDMEYLKQLLEENNVSFFDTVPSVLKMYMTVTAQPFPRSLRMIYVGGEALSVELASTMAMQHSRVELWNLYGPTEVTVTSHGFNCALVNGELNFGQHVPIGKAVTNTTGYVLDGDREAAAIGVD